MGRSIYIEHIESTDPRLGRHVEHDSRSKQFAFMAAPSNAGKTIFHADNAPVLNQGDLGGCVGWTGADILNTQSYDTVRAKFNKGAFYTDMDGRHFYTAATKADGIKGVFPPNDTGSSGLGLAKALVKMGLIKSYQHAFTWEQYLAALAVQPVALGTLWTNKMFKPDRNGVVTVGDLTDANIAGGHEYMGRGRDAERGLNLCRNHWQPSWDQKFIREKVPGEFWIPDNDLKKLLANQGDVTVLRIS